MPPVYVVGEDALCCALGERLVVTLGTHELAQDPINTGGRTRLFEALPRYAKLARRHPVLCIADTDGGCALGFLKQYTPHDAPPDLLLRFAVTMSESWLLADRKGFSDFFKVPMTQVPTFPDAIMHAKRAVLALAMKSRRKLIRQEVVSREDSTRPGSGYNHHLCDFVKTHLDLLKAAEASPSLCRAIRRFSKLAAARR